MKKVLVFSLIAIVFLNSCTNNKFKIDVSDYKTDIKVKRFDSELFKFNKDSSLFYIGKYQKEFGDFYELYNSEVFQISLPENADYSENLYGFVQYWKINQIDVFIKKEFPDFKEEEKQINDAYSHYKYYFPKKNIPAFYTFFSAFGLSIITSDSIVGIGLDKYLGPKYSELYEKAQWNNYQQKRMRREMIVVDIMHAQAINDFPYQEEKGNLLENMIYEGKIQYFLNCMLPETADSLKWRYTSKQMKWAEENQKNIWNYLAEQKLLFSSDKLEIKKYVGDAPFTTPFSDKSAPRAASYIGYKIVEKFMENNSNISLEDLMKMNDSRKILTQSKFNP